MRGWFVTGTDTGVGKTALAAALLAAGRLAGRPWAAMKPVQTGVRRAGDGRLAGDLRLIAAAGGWVPSAAERSLAAPYVFAEPCSPHRAAALEGAAISFRRIRHAARMLAGRYEALIVEGAGGLLVPVRGRRTMMDLACALGLPLLIASRPGLGTLNHTLLTVAAARRAGLEVGGVALVRTKAGGPTALELDNATTLRRLGVPVLGWLPYMPGWPRRPRSAVELMLADPAARWLHRLAAAAGRWS